MKTHFERIARSGFLVTISTYGLLLLSDIIRPGFVSRYMSVHLLLIPAIIFGIWWSRYGEEYKEKLWIHYLLTLIFTIILSVITWRITRGSDQRALLTILSTITPILIALHIRSTNSYD